MKELIIIGSGGFGKSAIDIALENNLKIKGVIDSYKTTPLLGFPHLGNDILDIANYKDFDYFIAIGDPNIRDLFFTRLNDLKLNLINIIAKSASISRFAKLGNGVFIGKDAIINADSIINDNAIINTRALIEHGCTIGKSANISTNVTLNGDVIIGEKAFIGSNASIKNQLKISKNIIVGIGAVVINDLNIEGTYIGIPAKLLRRDNGK